MCTREGSLRESLQALSKPSSTRHRHECNPNCLFWDRSYDFVGRIRQFGVDSSSTNHGLYEGRPLKSRCRRHIREHMVWQGRE